MTALYELVPRQASGSVGSLRIRYKEPGAPSSEEVVASITDEGKSAYDATPDTQFAAAVAELGMLLRNSPYKGSANWSDVIALARSTRGEDVDGDREELIRLIGRGESLLGGEKVAKK